jgi:hypothetical protein
VKLLRISRTTLMMAGTPGVASRIAPQLPGSSVASIAPKEAPEVKNPACPDLAAIVCTNHYGSLAMSGVDQEKNALRTPSHQITVFARLADDSYSCTTVTQNDDRLVIVMNGRAVYGGRADGKAGALESDDAKIVLDSFLNFQGSCANLMLQTANDLGPQL